MDVKFENVSLAYEHKSEVLHDLRFVIPKGKLTCLLGPSGCGKSTTLNLISGLLQPTAGKIFFDNEDVTKKDALARKVGMVFQNYALYPHMTVLENICFPLKMKKIDKKSRIQRGNELAQLVHVEKELAKYPGEISGGQQQRVAIARALAKEPSILLLDEPLSNLDARLRVEMREEIRRIQKQTGVTTVFVTHDQDEAMHVSDYIMVLNNGKIQQFADPNTIYDYPDNLFVASFIGNPVINKLPFSILSHEFSSVIPTTIDKKAETLLIRAESIVPTRDHQDHVAIKLQGKVLAVQRYGHEMFVRLNVNGQELMVTGFKERDLLEKQQMLEFTLRTNGVFIADSDKAIIWNATSI
ncbi:ABC transporter ATP-binding protein [Liquorilactobacillus hordei]|uniref:ABC transporter ATP-binding protein n=1 Tax=Liquorilactobacillus hordei TaxID=468911 RepID=UPI0039E78388